MALGQRMMQRLIGLGQNKAIRGAGTLAIGTAIGQSIVMASAPLLTRLFTPAEMGVFGTFTAITNLFIAFICLRLEQTLLLVEETERRVAAASCMVATLAVTTLFMVLIFFIPSSLLKITDDLRKTLLIFGPITLLSTSMYVICQHLALRGDRLRDIAKYQVVKAIVATSLQVTAALIGFGFVGLVGGQCAGLLIAAMPLALRNRQLFASTILVQWREVGRTIRKFSSFPLFGAPQAALNATAASLPLLMLNAFFGPVQVGLFWLGLRVFGLPNQVIVESIRGSILNEFSARLRDGRDLSRPLLKTTILMAAILLPVLTLLILFGDRIFTIVFGPVWAQSGTITAILSVSWIFQNASIPSIVLLQLTQRQRAVLLLEIFGTVARIIALSSGIFFPSIYFVISMFVIANMIQAIITMTFTFANAVRSKSLSKDCYGL